MLVQTLRKIVIGALLVAATALFVASHWAKVREARESFGEPQVYWKDTNQLYLMGRAVEHGMSPYLLLSDLAKKWLPEWKPYPYAAPYPPVVAVLSRGFAEVGYRNTVRINFWIEVASYGLLTGLLLWWWGGAWYRWEKLLVLAVLWTTSAFLEDIRCGQMMAMLAAILSLAWIALRSGKDITGGVLLGLFISVKLIVWPIVIFLLLRGRWRAVLAAGGVVTASNLLGLAVLGPQVVWDYYTSVGGAVAEVWRGYEANLSAWTWGDRIFRGVGWGFRLEPLVAHPVLASAATWIFPLGLFLVGLAMALRAQAFDTAFGLLSVVTILVSPAAWSFYALLAAVPVAVLLKRMTVSRAPAEAWCLAVMLLLALFAPPEFGSRLARAFDDPARVGFTAGLFTQLPNLALIGLAWMLWRTDSSASRTAGLPPSDLPPDTDCLSPRVAPCSSHEQRLSHHPSQVP